MTRWLVLACALFAGTPTSPLRAETAPVAKTLFLESIDQKLTTTFDGRRNLASDAAAYCSLIEHDFPRNSPSEDQWLDGEIAGGADRMMRALGSAEFGRRRAAVFVSECHTFSEVLQATPDSAKGFAGLAFAFVRFSGDASDAARRNNLNADFYGFPVLHEATEALLMAALAATRL